MKKVFRASRHVLLSGVALAASMAMSGIAAAQDTGSAADDTDGTENKVILVTANRREQSLLSVPLAISAIDGETLTATGVTSMTGLRFNTPGYSSVSGTGYTQIYVRGIGNLIFVGADPSVATFVDDVPRVFASLVDDLTFIDRIEVLKGAQGGLYGRNATGGAINIITRQPGDELAAEVQVSYGNKKTLDANVYFNVPLNENVAFNFVASRKSHDDYTPNKAIANPYQSYSQLSAAEATAFGDTGQRQFLINNPAVAAGLDSGTAVSDMNNQDFWFFNGKLRFQGDGFKVTLAADYQKGDDANGNGWIAARDTTPAFGVYQFLAGAFGVGGAALPFNYVFLQPEGKYDTLGSITHNSLQEDYGFSAKAEIDMPGFTLTSITAFRWNKSQFRGDIGAANVPIAGFVTVFDRRNIYQELRAVSSGDGPFRWLAGMTYYHETIDNLLASIVLGTPFAPTIAETKVDAYSAYVQGEYDLTDRLTVTGSLRYIDEKKTGIYPAQSVSIFDPVANVLNNNVAVGAVTGSTKVSKLLPSINLSYKVGDGVVYVRWARGLKTGGVNPIVHPAQTGGVVNDFLPEQVDTYEAGLRTSLFDGKVQFTSAIFYNDYTNLQVTKTGFSGLPFIIVNAGSAETYGAEATVDWRVTRYFTLQANVGYLKAKYKNFACLGDGVFCLPDLQVRAFDSSGNQLVQSPEWQGGITAALDVPVTDNWNFASTALFSFSSSFFPDDTNLPRNAPAGQTCFQIGGCGIPQKSYQLLNLRAGVHSADDRIGIYVSVRNVFNKFYQAFGTSSGTAIYQIPGSPRIGMLQINLKY